MNTGASGNYQSVSDVRKNRTRERLGFYEFFNRILATYAPSSARHRSETYLCVLTFLCLLHCCAFDVCYGEIKQENPTFGINSTKADVLMPLACRVCDNTVQLEPAACQFENVKPYIRFWNPVAPLNPPLALNP